MSQFEGPIEQVFNPIFELVVPGRPQRWMRPAQGIDPRTGRAIRFTDKVPAAHKKMVAKLAGQAWNKPFLLGPVALSVHGIFKPWANMTKAEQSALANGAIWHDSDPDLDQLVKQIQDSLSGIVYEDDCQVAVYHNCLKRYGSPERTIIRVYELDQPNGIRTSRQKRLDKKHERKLI